MNPNTYYKEGWLATGNANAVVGVTFTASHCKKHFDWPTRSNYNLRDHKNEVCRFNSMFCRFVKDR